MDIKVINLSDCNPQKSQGFQRISIFNPENTDHGKISLEYVILPRGRESLPHSHIQVHTAVFTISGRVRIYFGDKLENTVVVVPGGCVYIPPNVIHYVVNEHDEDMIAVVARTSEHKYLVEEYSELVSLINHHN